MSLTGSIASTASRILIIQSSAIAAKTIYLYSLKNIIKYNLPKLFAAVEFLQEAAFKY